LALTAGLFDALVPGQQQRDQKLGVLYELTKLIEKYAIA
jgi:hypothetical protein